MKRTDAAGNVGGLFTDGNDAAGIEATVLDETWANNVQEELVALATAAGAPLDGSNRTQALQAMRALFVRNVDHTIAIGWSGARLLAHVDGTNLGELAFYGDLPELGYTPVRQGEGPFQGPDPVSIGWAPTVGRLLASVNGNNLGAIAFLNQLPAPLGFTPVHQGAGPLQDANIISIGWNNLNGKLLASVDGGDHGALAFESQIPAPLGFTPVHQGAGPSQDANTVSIGWNILNSKLLAAIDGGDRGALAFEGWADARFKRLGNDYGTLVAFDASGTLVVPAGVTRMLYLVVGGGGSGGAGVGGQWAGGGGGGGGAVEGVALVTPGQVITVTIGTGGTPAGAGSVGGAGGTSLFGPYAGALGGSGGGSNSPHSGGGRGGTGYGAAGTAFVIYAGADGTDGIGADYVTALAGVVPFAGNGGAAGGGIGGGARGGQAGGFSALTPGSGGGGSYGQQSASGGFGGAGFCIVRF